MKPNKRNFTYTVKKTASRVKAFLINKKSPSLYAEQSRRLLESGNEKQAKNMLHKGVSFIPIVFSFTENMHCTIWEKKSGKRLPNIGIRYLHLPTNTCLKK